MKKPKVKFAEVNVTPFRQFVVVAIGEDVYGTIDRLSEQISPGDHSHASSPTTTASFAILETENGDYKLMVFKPCVTAESIAHECFHAIVYLAGSARVGDPITEGSDESWAYIFERLFGNVMWQYQNLGGKIKLPPKK